LLPPPPKSAAQVVAHVYVQAVVSTLKNIYNISIWIQICTALCILKMNSAIQHLRIVAMVKFY
jgi:hypothetical protein